MKVYLSFFILSLFISAAVAQDSDVRSQIERNNEKWEQAMLNNDINAVLDMYADDIISLPSYAPMQRGKDEIKKSIEKDIQAGNKITKVNFETIDIRQEGNMAVEVGTYDMTIMTGDSGEEWSDQGKYVTVWEKEGSEWKAVVEAWNSDTNPMDKMKNMEGEREDSIE